MHVKKLMVSHEFSTEDTHVAYRYDDPLRTSQVWRGNTPIKGRQRLPRGCHAGGTRPNASWAAAARAATSATTTRPAPVPPGTDPPIENRKSARVSDTASTSPSRPTAVLPAAAHLQTTWGSVLGQQREREDRGRASTCASGRDDGRGRKERAQGWDEAHRFREISGSSSRQRRRRGWSRPCLRRCGRSTPAQARGGAKRRIPAPDCMAAGAGTGDIIHALEPLVTPSPKL